MLVIGWTHAIQSAILSPSSASVNAIKGAESAAFFNLDVSKYFFKKCANHSKTDAEKEVIAEQEIRPSLRFISDESDKIYRSGDTFQLICEADFHLDWKLPSILETRDYVSRITFHKKI